MLDDIVARDATAGDDAVIGMNVNEPAALVIQAVVVADRRAAALHAGLEPERSEDGLEACRVGACDEQVEIPHSPQRSGEIDVALPVTVANAGAVERFDQDAERAAELRLVRRSVRRSVWHRFGIAADCRHRTKSSTSFAKALHETSLVGRRYGRGGRNAPGLRGFDSAAAGLCGEWYGRARPRVAP